MSSINITVFKWAGSWGPFSVKIPCGECSLTGDIIQDTIDAEFSDIDITLDTREWLSEWWKPLLKGGWHAPIIMVEGKIISQGKALNRGVLIQAVTEAHALKQSISGNIIFGKENCPHCQTAKENLHKANIPFTYLDVVKKPKALYEMIARVKPIIGEKTPVTVPQIWLEGNYVGGSNELAQQLNT